MFLLTNVSRWLISINHVFDSNSSFCRFRHSFLMRCIILSLLNVLVLFKWDNWWGLKLHQFPRSQKIFARKKMWGVELLWKLQSTEAKKMDRFAYKIEIFMSPYKRWGALDRYNWYTKCVAYLMSHFLGGIIVFVV